MSPAKPVRKACLLLPLGLAALCLLAVAASALSNLGLPQHSTTVDRLGELEKARLEEALQLRRELGEAAWPGWGQADIPIIVYNERYAFLVGYPNPPDGWRKVPSLESRGGSWEAVPDDAFLGNPYYRTPIADPAQTPEAFTVRVGEKWAATFQTREYSEAAFYQGFRRDLPPAIAPLVPLRLAWALLMGKTENYIAALQHESFHAYQGQLAAERLAAAERSAAGEGYPFDAQEEAWRQEMRALVQAAQAKSPEEARGLARQFLRLRLARRAGLSAAQVEHERLREWEEGLAKYAELEITRLAEASEGYTPAERLAGDPGFRGYQGWQQFWSAQLREAQNTAGRSGDTRFYYAGNAQAVLLDRLLPGWKPRALPGGEYLDRLLEEAVEDGLSHSALAAWGMADRDRDRPYECSCTPAAADWPWPRPGRR